MAHREHGRPLPSAQELLERLTDVGEGESAVFLDYDGTLTPIVATPELAVLGEEMRHTLERLTRVAHVTVVSGRDLDDLVDQAGGIPGAIYAGSHGYEVQYADDKREVYGNGDAYADDLAAAAEALNPRLAGAPGIRIERKRFAVAVHYRQAPLTVGTQIRDIVNEVARAHPRLQVLPGKKVFELRPASAWDKGTLVEALLRDWQRVESPIYIGDDTTDEDGFRAVRHRGCGIYVGRATFTHARHRLDDVEAVRRWLDVLAAGLARAASTSSTPA